MRNEIEVRSLISHQHRDKPCAAELRLPENRDRRSRILIAEKSNFHDLDAGRGHTLSGVHENARLRRKIADSRTNRQPARDATHDLTNHGFGKRAQRARRRILAIDHVGATGKHQARLSGARHARQKGGTPPFQNINHSIVREYEIADPREIRWRRCGSAPGAPQPGHGAEHPSGSRPHPGRHSPVPARGARCASRVVLPRSGHG